MSTHSVGAKAYFWPLVSILYSAWELSRPHSKWMFVAWTLSLVSSVAWVFLVPFLARLQRDAEPS